MRAALPSRTKAQKSKTQATAEPLFGFAFGLYGSGVYERVTRSAGPPADFVSGEDATLRIFTTATDAA